MIARIYARQSKDKKDSLSTDFQIERGIEYCKFHHIDKYEVYCDKGWSAKNLKRPDMQRMLKDIESSDDKNIIIIYKYDRISRNLYDFITLTHDFVEKDTGIVSLSENFDTSQAFGRAIVMQLMVFAQLEREQTGERIKDNAFDRAKLGRFIGGTPSFGYLNIKKTDSSGKKYATLVKKDDEMELLNKIFTEYIKPEMSSRKLALTLNQQGYLTRNGKSWNSSKITRILKNFSYAPNTIKMYNYIKEHTNYEIFNDKSEFDGKSGLFTYRKDTMGKDCYIMIGNYEPLIDDDVWIMANQKLEKNTNNAPNDKRGKTSILSGLLVCGKCGNKMRIANASSSGDSKYRYFKCRGKSDLGAEFCNMPNVKVQYVEEIVLDAVNKYIDTDKLLEKIITKRDSFKKQKDSSMQEIKEAENRIDFINSRISDLISSFDDETVKKYVDIEVKKLDAEKTELEKRINQLKLKYGDSFNQEASLDLIRSTITDFKATFEKASHEQKQAMLQYLIRDIIVYEDHIKINFFEQDFSSLSHSAFWYQTNIQEIPKNKIITIDIYFDYFNNPKNHVSQFCIDINTLGGQIRSARMKKRLRINELARIIGISSVTLSKWELNKEHPKKKLKEYKKLKEFLQIGRD